MACCLPYIIKRVLKRSVLVQFAREHPEYSAGDCATAETLISDFFHRLTCDSVSQFTKEQQRVVREKSEALEQTNQARDRLNPHGLARTAQRAQCPHTICSTSPRWSPVGRS